MKKILAGLLLVSSSIAFAGPHHGHWHRNHSSHWNWAPFVIGAATGAVIYDIYNRPVVVQQPPVVVQQSQNCSPWTEIQNTDGTITRTRTCTQ